LKLHETKDVLSNLHCVNVYPRILCNCCMVKRYETRQDMVADLDIRGTFVILGVFNGDFAADILRICPNVSNLILVDDWLGNPDYNQIVRYDGEYIYNYVKDRFRNEPRVNIVRSLTTTYLDSLPIDSIDAVYIDANRGCFYKKGYPEFKKDLVKVLSKVKVGGWILGHDIISCCHHNYWFCMKPALEEFHAENGLVTSIISMDGCSSFGIQKT
jgi:hypothetical protein